MRYGRDVEGMMVGRWVDGCWVARVARCPVGAGCRAGAGRESGEDRSGMAGSFCWGDDGGPGGGVLGL